MKKTLFIIMALMLALLTGCTTAVYTEPEPTPQPVRMTVISAADEFSDAVEQNADVDIQITGTDNAEDADWDVALVYMPESEDIAGLTSADVVLTDEPDLLPEDVSAVTVDGSAAVQAAWDALYAYPTHSTPVRMFMLCEDAEGYAKECFDAMVLEGRLQDKGCYVQAGAEQTAEEWVAERLDDITVGLLDTIYAETEELAIAAYNALRAAERNDSVEVICPVLSEKLIELMMEDHWSMGVCVGISVQEGAKAMLELADNVMNDGAVNRVELKPRVICSDDVKALMDAGTQTAAEILAELMK